MLNADELKHGPGPRLAFLASLDAQSLAEIMVAFANTEGGIVVVGLEANGQPAKGATISEDGVQKLLEAAENLFNPGIVIEDWEELDLEDDGFFDTNVALIEGRIIIPANSVPRPAETISETPPAALVPANDGIVSAAAPTETPALADESEKASSIALEVPAPPSVSLAVPVEAPTEAQLPAAQEAAANSVPAATDTTVSSAEPALKTDGATPDVLSEMPAETDSVEASTPADTTAMPPVATSDTAKSAEAASSAEVVAVDTVVPSLPETPTPAPDAAASPAVADGAPSALNPEPSITEPTPESPASAVVPVSEPAPEKPTLPLLYGVKIPRSIELHALNDGRVLIRSGARNRPLGGQEILRLASAKGTGEFEAEVVPGASQADFSRRLIDEYLLKRAERTKRPFSGSIDDMLLEIGALTPDRHPTTAGILLFSEYPQKWLPQSGVIFARFVGTQPRGESGMAGYIRREEITGPLPRLIESAWNLVWSEMAVSAVVSGLEREERAEYPQFAVREAIVNSICHRDYRLRGRRIELRMYSDRLEVISPGGLPGFITVENIKDEHFSRNPRIVNGLFQWGYIEELGLGIDRMIEVMEQAGREPPQFDARPYSFAVNLNNEREKQRPLDWIRSANHRQARAMQYIREHGSITNREYRILCAGVSAETLRLDLAGMVDRGQLIKVGSKKGTHYILRDKDVSDPEVS